MTMATISAAQSGNWSATSTWTGGVVPGVGDTAYANGFTVTIDVSASVATLRTIAGTGISAGGTFVIAAGGIDFTIANGIAAADGANILSFTHNSGTSSVTATNNSFYGANSNNRNMISVSGSGTAVLNGNVIGSPNATLTVITNSGSGALVINGNVTGGSPSTGSASNTTLVNSGGGSVTINGNVTGGSSHTGDVAISNTNGTVTVNGTVTGGSSSTSYGIANSATGSVTINGSVIGGSAAAAVSLSSSGSVIVNGNVTGGVGAEGVIVSSSTGSLSITGDVVASSTADAVTNAGSARIGTSGQTSQMKNIGKWQAVDGPWMVVTGAAILLEVPTDSDFPAYSGTKTTLSEQGKTMGDGLILLSDVAKVVGAQIAAASTTFVETEEIDPFLMMGA